MADMLYGIIHSYCIKKRALNTKINLKNQFEFHVPSQKSYQLQPFMPPLSDIEIMSFHPL
jgi:hypothetical protein